MSNSRIVDDSVPELSEPLPEGIDRRSFLMRNAAIGAAAVMTGTAWTPEARAQQAAKEATAQLAAKAADKGDLGLKMSGALSPDLDVVKKSKGPVMTVLEEFYKVGPGPSSSHTIGPMRITYDFYQRCTKLPADQLAKATGLKVHLFGSLSATGKGHGTERASLAGLIGKEPATVDPLFLDEMIAKPEQTYPVKLGDKTFNLSLADIIYDAAEGRLPAPEHHDVQAHGRRQGALRAGVLLGRRRVHRVEGLQAAQEGPAEVPLRDDEGAAPARGEEQPLDRRRSSWRTRWPCPARPRSRSTRSSTRSPARCWRP